MSDKKPTTKYEEPIKLDTTILKIDVKTKGDLITKDYDLIPFHPNMSDIKDLSNNNYIFFPTFAKITMNDLKNAKVGTNYLKVFTSLDKYLKLVEYIASDARETDNTLIVDQSRAKQYAMSILEDITGDVVEDFVTVQKEENTDEGLTDEEIITNNIGLIKSIFFPRKGLFYVLSHEYVIGKSKYIPPFESSDDFNPKLKAKHLVPLTYTITIDLDLLDATNNPDAGDFGRLSCKAKKISIKNDVVDLFGAKFKYKQQEQKAVLPSLLKLPPEITERGFTKLQKEWEARNKYVKPPETEAERLALEKSWTPLQKKMAQLDKTQLEFNKIPQLWVKDQNDLEEKYKNYFVAIKKYREEINEIRKNNNNDDGTESSFVKDLTQAVVDNMALETKNLLVDVDKIQAFGIDDSKYKDFEKDIKDLVLMKPNPETEQELNTSDTEEKIKRQIREKWEEYTKLNYSSRNDYNRISGTGLDTDRLKDLALQMVMLKKLDALIKTVEKYKNIEEKDKIEDLKNGIEDFKKMEESIIDAKYVDPFLEDLKIKQKDVYYLTKEEEKLNNDIKKDEGDKTNIFKKDELAKMRAKLFKKQVELRKLEESLGKNGQKIIVKWKDGRDKMNSFKKTIKSEKKLQETRIVNDTVNKELKDKFVEIDEAKKLFLIVSAFAGEEKELTKDEKEKFAKKDKPVEKYSDLESNIKALENDYLEIANKLGIEKQIQAKITLLNYDVERLKLVKKAKEEERKKKDDELEGKDKSKKKILDNYISSTGSKIKDIPPEEQKRIDDLTAEQNPIRVFIDIIKITIDRINKKRILYEALIDDLKKIKDEKTYEDKLENFKKKLVELKTYEDKIEALSSREMDPNEIDTEMDRLIAEEIKKLPDGVPNKAEKTDKIKNKKTDEEFQRNAINALKEIKRKRYEDAYLKKIKELEQIPVSGGQLSSSKHANKNRRHNTRRNKRVNRKKTIRKNMKKSANKKNRTYKRRKMAKKTIRYRTRM